MEPGQKRCQRCGRIGSRGFVQVLPGPSWMGPWHCEHTGACWHRQEATEPETDIRDLEIVDLDALQAKTEEH